MEAALASLAWVPYTAAERKSVFDPAFGEFVKWAAGARQRRQTGLNNVASANKKVDAAKAELSKRQADKKPANEIKDAENRVKAETEQLAKYTAAVKAADTAEPVEKQQAVVMANIALNFVMKWTYSSEPISVTVAPKE